jgi:cytochrome c
MVLARLRSILLISIVVWAAAGQARAEDPRALLQKYKCYVCHADAKTKTGPAFVDVAARYRGDPRAPAALAAAVKDGAHGAGPWHMPPHPEVTDADAKRMVRYILSLR